MLPVTPYTNTDAIRGCLGVTENELLDEMIVNARFDLQLETDLDQWLPGHSLLKDAADAASDAVNASLVLKDTAEETLTASETSLASAGARLHLADVALAAAQASYDTASQNPPVSPTITADLAAAQQERTDALAEQTTATTAYNQADAAFTAAKSDLAEKTALLKVARKTTGLITLYSMWFCVALAVPVVQMAAPKKNTNGKDAFERFANAADGLLMNAKMQTEKFKDMLSTDQGITDALGTLVLAARSVPEYDPMTNDGYTE